MKRLTHLAIALVAIMSLAACSNDVTSPTAADKINPLDPGNAPMSPSGQSIAEIADANGFNLLLAAVNYIADANPGSRTVAGLLDASDLTVFAPTDEAFLKLVEAVEPLLDAEILANDGPFAAIDALLGAGTIEAVVSYHVTAGSRTAASLVPARGEREVKTLLNVPFRVTAGGMILAVGNTANIVGTNIVASNGIVHVIDTVILPIELELGGRVGGVEGWIARPIELPVAPRAGPARVRPAFVVARADRHVEVAS
ncbi:MAG: fasciclin domain-containing protein [Candidatus Krumholzibacteriia bacterium]